MADLKRIAVISQLPPPVHGSTLMTEILISSLESLKYETTLVDRRFSSKIDEVGKFNFKKIFSGISLTIRLIGALISFKPGITIFFSTTSVASFLVDWLLSEILRMSNTKVILYIHTLGYGRLATKGKLWQFLVKRLLNSSSVNVTLADRLNIDISQYSDSPIVSIPNTIPQLPAELDRLQVDQRETVLFLSNLIPGKGHETFLQLALLSIKNKINLKFLLAGAASPATIKELNEFIIHHKLTENVEYVGLVGAEKKWELLRNSKMLVFPSSYTKETAGLVQLEAIYAGTPVLGYNTGGLIPELVEAGVAKSVAIGDFEALIENFKELIEDEKTLNNMSFRGPNVYQSKYSLSAYRNNWRELLLSVEKPFF